MEAEKFQQQLINTYCYYKGSAMSIDEREAAHMIKPVPASVGFYNWQLSNGKVFQNGIRAISAQRKLNQSH